mmetsp:Transcript_28643/g.73487  ORF Transcript_28643/g.73487 Transcript_28643/m.73487 type:complete len:92 (+) Transcript_28643:2773-3048(+)
MLMMFITRTLGHSFFLRKLVPCSLFCMLCVDNCSSKGYRFLFVFNLCLHLLGYSLCRGFFPCQDFLRLLACFGCLSNCMVRNSLHLSGSSI